MNKNEVRILLYKNLRITAKKRTALLLSIIRPFYFIIFLVLVGVSLTSLVNRGYFTFMVGGMGLWLIFSSAFIGSATSYVREGNSLESLNPLPFDKRSIYVAGGIAECIFAAPSTVVLLGLLYWYYAIPLVNLLPVLTLLSIGILIAIQLGGLCALATIKASWLNQAPRILERAMFLSSGAFYYPQIVPAQLQKIFLLLPHTQFISIGRGLITGEGNLAGYKYGAILLLWLLLLTAIHSFLKEHYELVELREK